MATAPQTWHLDPSDGRLLIRTGVAGPAAKLGHRLTIALNTWQAAVEWADGQPAALHMAVDVESLEVLSGEGGATPLTPPEKSLARSNALKVLDAKRFPEISFHSSTIERTQSGYRLAGTVQIHGTARDCAVDLSVEDDDIWRMSCDVVVRHSDFGLKPYSMLMGAMKVADAVTVSFTGERVKTL